MSSNQQSINGKVKLKMLNLGCGDTYHPDWVNVDLRRSGNTLCRDVTEGLPFPDETFDVLYHSHLLEHLPSESALPFMRECYRVMKAKGLIRILVPDLEQIAKLYLEKLNTAQSAESEYDWMMLELYDQSVRDKSGGNMLEFLRQNPLPNETFIYERIGEEGRDLVFSIRQQNKQKKSFDLPHFLGKVRTYAFQKIRLFLKESLATMVLGTRGLREYEIGRFRLSGEIHQWMYDRYSLPQLVRGIGFQEIQLADHFTSRIPNWQNYHLDVSSDGQVFKPDLFFLEAIKP